MSKLLCLLLVLSVWLPGYSQQGESKNFINTVNGPVKTSGLGFTLSHEHLFSNFGKDVEITGIYNEEKLYIQVVPYLRKIKALGVNSIFDCTTAHFGRRVDILKNLADSTGVQVITNTGFYGAANDRYVPAFAFNSTPQEIADIWIAEFKNGIDNTGIKPGFIKLGFDGGTPSEIDRKLFAAGILTHRQTGMTIAVHTGNNAEAIRIQLQLLKELDTNPSALVIVHANMVKDSLLLEKAAGEGAWLSLDGVKQSNIKEYTAKLKWYKSQNLLHKVLLSHDGNGFNKDGDLRDFNAIMEYLIPALRAEGFSPKEIDMMTIVNPLLAFGLKRK